MNRVPTPGDVLRDIEFELLQGVIVDGSLGQAILAVKKHQSQLRADAFRNGAWTAEVRDVLSRQFQVNDMLLVLLAELAHSVEATQFEQRQMAARAVLPAFAETEQTRGEQRAPVESRPNTLVAPIPLKARDGWPQPTELLELMRADALNVDPDVRAVRMPLIGHFLTRMRAAMHSLVVFYVLRLARRQSAANQVIGRWLLFTSEQQRLQAAQLERLPEQEKTAQPDGREHPRSGP